MKMKRKIALLCCISMFLLHIAIQVNAEEMCNETVFSTTESIEHMRMSSDNEEIMAIVDENNLYMPNSIKNVDESIIASGTCGESLTWILTHDGTLTISGEGEMDNNPWEEYYLKVKKLVLEEGVTSVCDSAFYEFKVLKEVSFPDSLLKIDSNAFRDCISLQSVIIPNNAEVYISAFGGCTALTNAIINGTLQEGHIFGRCTSLKKVILGENCEYIPWYSFSDCYDLEEIVVPDTLTYIGQEAFSFCGNLKSITIPSSVTCIDNMAFYGCYGMEEVHISDLAAWCNIDFRYSIGSSDGSNPLVYGEPILYLNGEAVENIVLTDDIPVVKPYAFWWYEHLKNVEITSGTEVQHHAFENCRNLESVVINEGITILPEGLFEYCRSLKEITLPVSLCVIDENVFNMTRDIDWEKYPQVIEKVNYSGTEDQWNDITILPGNEQLIVAYQRTNCEHIWESKDVLEASCTEAGYECYICSICESEKSIIIDAQGHCWIEDSAIAPTCTTAGKTEGKHCSVCNEILNKQETVPALGHDIVIDKAVAATCEGTGLTEGSHCSRCDDQTIAQKVIPAKGHSWEDDYTIDKESSCSEEGSKSIHCANCDETKDVVAIEKLDHVYDEGVVTVEPTIQKEGEIVYTCQECGDTHTEILPVVEIILPFTDVPSHKWFYESVKWAYGNGLLTGTSATLFSPNAPMTRGMLVTVLYRKEGRPYVVGNNKFPDVSSSKYYAVSIIWASSLKIVSGYTDGTFGPEDSITREQMAKILYRYAEYKGYDVTATEELDGFSDASQVSGYAKKYMQWTVAEGLIKGSNGKLNPKGNATRAEIAAILKRFVERYEVQ